MILQVKDTNGNWIGIPAIQGAPGKDGAQGPKGNDGAPGKDGANGAPGKDGYTPVKGVDYWTAADKQQIITEVSNSVDIERIDIKGTDAEMLAGFKAIYQDWEANGAPNLSNVYIKHNTIVRGEKSGTVMYLTTCIDKNYGEYATYRYPATNSSGDYDYENFTKTVIPTGGGGESSGGGECRSILLPQYSNKLTDEHKAFLEEMWQYYKTNNAIMPADIYIEMDMFDEKAAPSCIAIDTSNNRIRMYVDTQNFIGEVTYYSFANGVYSGNVGTNLNMKDIGGDGWNITYEAYGDGIYNANEIYIMCSSNSDLKAYSYVALPPETTLGGYYSYTNFPLNLTFDTKNNEYVPYWHYDGSWIYLNEANGWNIDYVLYK